MSAGSLLYEPRFSWDRAAVVVALILAAGYTIANNWGFWRTPHEEGLWVEMSAGEVHRANVDGFVIARSVGDVEEVQTGVIFEGASRDTLARRTRFGRFGRATLPVREGRFWEVEPRGNGAPIVVLWSPAP